MLNFVGAFISLQVAATVASDVVDPEAITTTVIFAGLFGAICWNLITWYYGLPSSSSHALIGGIVGATLVASGVDAIFGEGILGKVLIPALVAPVVAFIVGGDRDRHLLPDRRPPAARHGDARASGAARSSPEGCSRSPTARTTRRRRWA